MADSRSGLWAGKGSSQKEDRGPLRGELSQEEIEAEVGRKTTEAWVRRAYRAWKKRKESPKKPTEAAALNRELKGLSAVELGRIREIALKKIQSP